MLLILLAVHLLLLRVVLALTGDALRVDDLVGGRGRHEIVIRWQLTPGSALRVEGGRALVTSRAGAFLVALEASGPVLLTAGTGQVATGFGNTADAPVLTCRMDASVPAWISTVWSRARGRAEGEGTA